MTEKEITNIFSDLLNGKLKPNKVHEIFDGKTLWYSNKVEIIIYPKNLVAILNSYLKGEKTENDLYAWAYFIRGVACFVQPNTGYCRDNPDDYAAEDKYENMWFVIQQLSCPSVDGKITPERAKQYIKHLSEQYDD